MSRIRAIKPETFTDERFVSLTPLARLFYIALWCEADREGRLEWNLKTLKWKCLPADDCDIESIGKELLDTGRVILYTCDGQVYGLLPKFVKHQHINTREAQSKIPAPPGARPVITPPELVQEPDTHVHARESTDLARGEGKGREGKEEEHPSDGADASLKDQIFGPCLATLAKRTGKSEAQCRPLVAKWLHAHGDGPVVEAITAMSRNSAVEPVSYIEALLAKKPAKPGAKRTDAELETALLKYKRDGTWPAVGYGPEPGYGGCTVPHKLLAKHDLIERNIVMAG